MYTGSSSVQLDDSVPESHSQQLVSLVLASYPLFKNAGLSVIFRPWREYLAYVKATPSFPHNLANYDAQGASSMVLDAVLERPSVCFVQWERRASSEVYPHHPHESRRHEHNIYWALLTLMCITHHTIKATVFENTSTHDMDRRVWSFFAAHAPLAQIFYDFAQLHGRVPTDTEYLEHVSASPLPRTRFTHPTLHVPCLLLPSDVARTVSFVDTEHTEPPPMDRVRRELHTLGWIPSGATMDPALDAVLSVEFGDTLRYARTQMTATERLVMYAQEFVHFRIEDLDPSFVFNPETMLICFAACWRVNQLSALVLALIDRYAVTVNIGAAEVTAAPAGLFDNTGSVDPVAAQDFQNGAAFEQGPDGQPPAARAGGSMRGAREQRRMMAFIANVDRILLMGGMFGADGAARVPPASGRRVDRFRRIVAGPIRRVIYGLKEAMTSHHELLQWCMRTRGYTDSDITATDPTCGASFYETVYPFPQRAIGYKQQRDLSPSMCDMPWLRNNIVPVSKQNPNQRLWQEPAYFDAHMHTFFDKSELKAGRDGWSLQYADVADKDIIEETYGSGQNRAFVDFMGSVLMLFHMGMYETSSTLVPYSEMLRAHAVFSPGARNYRRVAQTMNRDMAVARLAFKEHILCMLEGVPSMRHSLSEAYPEHFHNLVVQATLLADEVRCILNHPFRKNTPLYLTYVEPLFRGVVVQRSHTGTKGSSSKAAQERAASVVKNSGKRTKQRMREQHADMLRSTQRPAMDDIYALCGELIWFWRPRPVDGGIPPPEEAFFRNIANMYMELHQKPKATTPAAPESLLQAPGTMVYKLVDAQTRSAIIDFGRAHIERSRHVDLMALERFGVSRKTCELLSAMREAYCVTGNNKVGLKGVLLLEPHERFTVLYFCAVAAQMMSFRTIQLGSSAFASAQIQRTADALGVGAHEVTRSLTEVFFCTRSGAFHSPLQICAMGPRGVSTSYFSDAGPQNEARGVMKRRRPYPSLGMVHKNAVGVFLEFPLLMRSHHTYRRRAPASRKKSRTSAQPVVGTAAERPVTGKRATSNRDGYGGRGSARCLAQAVNKQSYEAAINVASKNPDHYPLMPLDVIRETYVVRSRTFNTITGAAMVSRHLPALRQAYPDRRPQFTVPDTMPDSATTFPFSKKIRSAYLTPCCGTFSVPSALQFNSYDEQEHAWCGHCPSAQNVRRYLPTCIVCGCFVNRELRDVRVYVYDDINDHCFRHCTLCDECHFYTCAIINGYVLSISILRRLRTEPEQVYAEFFGAKDTT